MSLAQQPLAMPALDQTYIALDLETTGLDADQDKIIQVGAVKFQGDRVIDTFDTFVNPGRAIPDFIQRLTGIRPDQVSRAPYFASVGQGLETFLEMHPIIGHNVSFDLRFLDTHGLKLANPSYDTWDLASFLLPGNPEYNLVALAKQFGITHRNAHQAIDDADATRQLFLTLLRRAAELSPALLAHTRNLALRSRWGVANLLSGLETENLNRREEGDRAIFGLNGLNLNHLAARLGHPERRSYDSNLTHLDEDKIAALMSPDGPFAETFPGFEQRPEQAEMLKAVAGAIYQGRHLIVEGGTGVGKSMAYLLPAALFAAARGQRVVISTNTINLQEQLINKDIPSLVEVLEGAGVVSPGLIKASQLKGRTNYLCLNRWNYLARNDNLSPDEARLLSKTAVWLQDTTSGDRGELNLAGRDGFSWSKISAGERGRCPNFQGGDRPCFLRSSRERAEQAHLVVVNHALLLSDLMRGGSIIPDYQHVIIDEAHNLEETATNQFSFQVGRERLGEDTESLTRLAREVRLALAGENLDSQARQNGEGRLNDAEALLPRIRENWESLWAAAEIFFNAQRSKTDDVRVTPQLRSQRSWADLTLAWEGVDVGLNNLIQLLARLEEFLETATVPQIKEQPGLALEANNVQTQLDELRGYLTAILGRPDEDNIHWLHRDTKDGGLTLHSAPLAVGPILAEKLYAKKESVVLTSATMSVGESFDFARHRLGLPEASAELRVGSPFDYRKAALLLTPEDMPEPQSPGYLDDIARVLIDLGGKLSGRTLALFTAYSALRHVERRIREPLNNAGIKVLAQGIDGPAQQLGRRFVDNQNNNVPTVLLGTSSFWEGVDFPGLLKALVITRLPFPVPTDPVFEARSAQYGNNAFNEYSVPLAVIRFRQGMGRLIRNKEDSGVIVVLDKRVTGRGYGKTFIQSIPDCARQPVNLASVGELADWWVKGANRGTGR